MINTGDHFKRLKDKDICKVVGVIMEGDKAIYKLISLKSKRILMYSEPKINELFINIKPLTK